MLKDDRSEWTGKFPQKVACPVVLCMVSPSFMSGMIACAVKEIAVKSSARMVAKGFEGRTESGHGLVSMVCVKAPCAVRARFCVRDGRVLTPKSMSTGTVFQDYNEMVYVCSCYVGVQYSV